MDAIDELLDAFRSERPTGRRNRRVLLLSVASVLVSFVIWRSWVADVDTRAMQPVGGPDMWGLADLLG